MAKMKGDQQTIKLAAIGAIILFNPDEISVEQTMQKDGSMDLIIKLYNNQLRDLRNEIEGKEDK